MQYKKKPVRKFEVPEANETLHMSKVRTSYFLLCVWSMADKYFLYSSNELDVGVILGEDTREDMKINVAEEGGPQMHSSLRCFR